MEFQFNRYAALLKRDFREYIWPSFMVMWIVIAIVLFFNFTGQITDGAKMINLHPQFWVCAYICCAIMGSISFSEVSKRHTRIEYLTLPATHSEKTLSKATSVMLVFPILFAISFVLLAYISFGLASWYYPNIFWKENSMPFLTWMDAIVGGLSIAGFFAYGSLLYNTGSFVKVIFRLFIAAVMIGLVSFLGALIIFPEFRSMIFGIESNYFVQSRPVKMDSFVNVMRFLYYSLPVLFWLLIYFILKEKEA